MSLNDADYKLAAEELGVSTAAIKAVAEIESSGQTFWTINGVQKPAVRLEAHWFGKLTAYRFSADHPNISSKEWNASLAAKTHDGAWNQYAEAAALDETACMQACSWGCFQIMGFHWKALGYPSVQEMVKTMDTEGGQLDAFVRFIKATPAAHQALKQLDWSAFEIAYNGGGFGGAYAKKMEAAYAKYL